MLRCAGGGRSLGSSSSQRELFAGDSCLLPRGCFPLDGDEAFRFSECPAADGIEKVYKNDFVVVQCVKGREARQADAEEAKEA